MNEFFVGRKCVEYRAKVRQLAGTKIHLKSIPFFIRFVFFSSRQFHGVIGCVCGRQFHGVIGCICGRYLQVYVLLSSSKTEATCLVMCESWDYVPRCPAELVLQCCLLRLFGLHRVKRPVSRGFAHFPPEDLTFEFTLESIWPIMSDRIESTRQAKRGARAG